MGIAGCVCSFRTLLAIKDSVLCHNHLHPLVSNYLKPTICHSNIRKRDPLSITVLAEVPGSALAACHGAAQAHPFPDT